MSEESKTMPDDLFGLTVQQVRGMAGYMAAFQGTVAAKAFADESVALASVGDVELAMLGAGELATFEVVRVPMVVDGQASLPLRWERTDVIDAMRAAAGR